MKTPNAIDKLLGNTLKELKKNTKPEMLRIWDFWDETVGEEIARHTKPAVYKDNLLIVHVGNSTWLQHLRFQNQEIVDKLNRVFGKEVVKELKFKIGNI